LHTQQKGEQGGEINYYTRKNKYPEECELNSPLAVHCLKIGRRKIVTYMSRHSKHTLESIIHANLTASLTGIFCSQLSFVVDEMNLILIIQIKTNDA
jgi:hypothetical protein